MVKEAEKFAEADKIRKEIVEEANKAESALNDIESHMREYKDQIPAEEAAELEKESAAVRDLLAQRDELESPDPLREAVYQLQQKSLKLYELVSKKNAAERESSSEGSSEDSGSDQQDSDSEKQITAVIHVYRNMDWNCSTDLVDINQGA